MKAVIMEKSASYKTSEQSILDRLELETFLSDLFSSFVNVQLDEFDDKINHAFQRIGRYVRADHCTLFHYRTETNAYVVTHLWSDEGIEALPLIGTDSREFPWLHSQTYSKKPLILNHLDEIPAEADSDKQKLAAMGIKSFLGVPILENQKPVGAIALWQTREHKKRSTAIIEPLQRIAVVLLNVLQKKRSEEKLQSAFEEINRLKSRLEIERDYLKEELKLEHNYENIIGQSQSLQYALLKVEQVAPTDTTALILGETGTGKELIARAIHDKSRRKKHPLIKVNCASLSSNIIESELFGHEKGAFTGAHTKRNGRFELADGATLFLDEIGELSLETQSKLLRVLQEGEFERMGSSHTIKVDVRIIASTNRKLAEEVETGRFRKDLWYRLNVFPITSPPLRKRKEDIPLLVDWLVKKICKKLGKQIEKIPTGTMKALENYYWPGNIRELENVIERAVISSPDNVLRLAEKLETDQTDELSKNRPIPLSEMEHDYIVRVLEETKWQIEGENGAAIILGLTPSSLRRRIIKYGIKRP